MLSTVKENDSEADGTVDERESITYTYDENGLLLSSNTTYSEDESDNGTIDVVRESIETYDDDGLIISTIVEEIYNNDSSDTSIEERESTVENYNSQGLLVFTSTLLEEYYVREGRSIDRDSVINTYNDDGLLVSNTIIDESISEFDENGDAIFNEVLITTDTNTYDEDGLLVFNTEIFETSYSEDGTIGYRSITTNTYTYDDDDLLISIATIEEVDENADGIIDYIYSKANKTNTYDDNGLLLSTSYEELNNDGGIEYSDLTTNTYNDDELLISTIHEEIQTNGDIRNRESTTNTYSDDGLLLSTDILYEERDYDEYSLFDARRESTTNVYNDDGILISTVYEEDKGANDIIDRRREVTDNYDEDGLLISTTTVEESDNDEDGLINDRDEVTENYNDEGLVISTTTVEESDNDGDRTFDRRLETVSTNTYNDEGLLVSTIEEKINEDGVADSKDSVINTYNDEGLLVSTIEEKFDNGTIFARNSTINAYDEDGLLTSTLFLADGGIYEYNSFDGEIDYSEETLYSQETNYVPTVVNSIADITVDEDADQTIDLSDVFEDIDSDTIELSVSNNSNPELVTPVLNGNDLTLNFLEYQSGTADISVIGTADGQSGEEETFTVTVNPTTIEFYRFNNNTTETGAYLFVAEAEKDAILADSDLSRAFTLEGVREDGSVNSAFKASSQPGENLIPLYRIKSANRPIGVYLFVGEEEYQSIFAEDSLQKDKWIKEGLDTEGNDIAEFYLYPSGSDLGESLYRFNNTHNGGYLFVGQEESAAIRSHSDLSDIFISEGEAFETLI